MKNVKAVSTRPVVCIVHGVGYQEPGSVETSSVARFAKDFGQQTGANTTLFQWQHPGPLPADPRNTFLFKYVREAVDEIIMDFSYVLFNLNMISAQLPLADLYIGHSAGGIIVSVKTDRPQILMGCPVQMINSVRMCSNGANVLNLMHYRDPVASPVNSAENVITYEPLLTSVVNPFEAHTAYWTSSEVMTQCLRWYDRYVRRA